MKEKEIASKLSFAYSILVKSGRTKEYYNINNEIAEYPSHSVDTKVNLCKHFLALTELDSFKKVAATISYDFIINILIGIQSSNKIFSIAEFSEWVIEYFPKNKVEVLVQGYSFAGHHSKNVKLLEHINDFDIFNFNTLNNLAKSSLECNCSDLSELTLEHILKYKPNDEFSLYNLAILKENQGLFNISKKIHYQNFDKNASVYSFSRLLNSEKKSNLKSLIKQYETFCLDEYTNEELIDLNFSLGFAHDRLGLYKEALEKYHKANKLARKSIESLNLQYFLELQLNIPFELKNDEKPIFICGMHRSGSTLLEQVLSSHSRFSNGGEVTFFSEKVVKYCLLGIKEAAEVAELYKSKFTNMNTVINKLPDNFIYIGLIKALFPNAKFIITKRNIDDNCISLYFQNMSAKYNYSTCLSELKDFYISHEKVTGVWREEFPNDVCFFQYEKFIEQPNQELAKLCNFLNINFEEEMLEFYKLKNNVRTASYNQIRSKLNRNSVNRFENYKRYLKNY